MLREVIRSGGDARAPRFANVPSTLRVNDPLLRYAYRRRYAGAARPHREAPETRPVAGCVRDLRDDPGTEARRVRIAHREVGGAEQVMRRTPDIAQLPAPTRIQATPSGGERHEQAIREPGNTSMWGPGNPNRREARERERSALRAAPRTRHGNSTSTSIESTTTHTPRPRPAERLRRENRVQWARWLRHEQHRTDTVATPERRRDDQTGRSPTARSATGSEPTAPDSEHREGRAPRRGRRRSEAGREGRVSDPLVIAISMPFGCLLVVSAAWLVLSASLVGFVGLRLAALGLSPMPGRLARARRG